MMNLVEGGSRSRSATTTMSKKQKLAEAQAQQETLEVLREAIQQGMRIWQTSVENVA